MDFSLGLIEIQALGHAILVLDTMTKAADVEFVAVERKLGGRLVTVIVEGQISAVKAAVEATNGAITKPCATAVIASPHSETRRMVNLSASRLLKKSNTKKTEESQKDN